MEYDKNGRIIRATVNELRKNWYSTGLYDLYSFDEYLIKMERAGVVILTDDPTPTMRDIRAHALKALDSYASKSCDSDLLKINRDIQHIFGDTPNHIVTYLERSMRSKESSAIVYSEEKGNPDSGSYHLRIGGYESTRTTDFYKPLSPHEAPQDVNLSGLIDGKWDD